MRLLILVFSLLITFTTSAQNSCFACKVFEKIITGLELQSKRYQVFLTIKDSIRHEIGKDSIKVLTNSSLKQTTVDSLVNFCKYKNRLSVFDDSIFNFRKTTLVLDSFCFFGNCSGNFNGNNFKFINITYPYSDEKYDSISNHKYGVIILKSIRTYSNSLVFAFQDYRSMFEIDVYVEMVANFEPTIKHIIKSYPLHQLTKEKDEKFLKELNEPDK